jgi:putative lipoprotein (rSAM/lipoprotein system)
MKRVRLFILHANNKFIAYILGMMGFASACLPEPVEYGMPHALFRVKGTVQSNTTELFIPNIQVKMGYNTTYTNEQGQFEIGIQEFPKDQSFIVQFRDIDGSVNGLYSGTDTTITFEKPEFTNGDGDWYEGETEKTVQIKLNPATDGK